jgi:hypothetical protein
MSDIAIEIKEGNTDVYADLGRPDADEMLIKAQLAAKIGDIIKRRRLTQVGAQTPAPPPAMRTGKGHGA